MVHAPGQHHTGSVARRCYSAGHRCGCSSRFPVPLCDGIRGGRSNAALPTGQCSEESPPSPHASRESRAFPLQTVPEHMPPSVVRPSPPKSVTAFGATPFRLHHNSRPQDLSLQKLSTMHCRRGTLFTAGAAAHLGLSWAILCDSPDFLVLSLDMWKRVP